LARRHGTPRKRGAAFLGILWPSRDGSALSALMSCHQGRLAICAFLFMT
jgi:hypothetical protein